MLSRDKWYGVIAVVAIAAIVLFMARRNRVAQEPGVPEAAAGRPSAAADSFEQAAARAPGAQPGAATNGASPSVPTTAGEASRGAPGGIAAAGSGAGSAPGASAPGGAALLAGAPGGGAAAAPGINAPRPSPPPPGYRPATTLRYSETPPSSSRGADDASPVLARIFQVTEATAEQQTLIRDLWHVHEDARRALVAAAPPRASGTPILDRSKLGPVDFAFESSVFSRVLNPAQRDRLALEVYPPRLTHGGSK